MSERFSGLQTPCLLLDTKRLAENAEQMRQRVQHIGVRLRPHIKTCKSVEVTNVALAGRQSGITASTLKEVEYFARAGFGDILYAVGISANKFSHVAQLIRQAGADLTLLTDHRDVAVAAAAFAAAENLRLKFLVEVDCGEHRGGLPPGSAELIEVARILHQAPNIDFKGLMTHGGHSYRHDQIADIERVAAEEVGAIAAAASGLREAGIPVEITSIGSTPTVLFGKDFEGVSEVRAGVYLFMDLSQYSRHVCRHEDIAVSVLATVIGHNKAGAAITIDAGALALSKDLGANDYLPSIGYGQVCDLENATPLGDLAVATVHQEHGTIPISDDAWYERLPLGSLLRILPNHVCMTAAAYSEYHLLSDGKVSGTWPRICGWY